jgi:hypothetical protein
MDDRIRALFSGASAPPKVAPCGETDAQKDATSASPKVKNALAKRCGAPLGNQNASKHGLTSSRFPPGTEYLSKELTRFKRLVNAAVLEIHGEVGFAHALLLQTAGEHHSHALRVRRWLRVGWEELSVDQVLAFSREIGRAFDARDKVLKQLGIDASGHDEGKRTLYQLPTLPDEPGGPVDCPPLDPPGQS